MNNFIQKKDHHCPWHRVRVTQYKKYKEFFINSRIGQQRSIFTNTSVCDKKIQVITLFLMCLLFMIVKINQLGKHDTLFIYAA